MRSRFVGRTLARSQALQLLFQAEANNRTVEEVLSGDYVLSEGPLEEYGRELALQTDAARHDLDAIISTRSKSWSLRRINAVDRNLLRIALYEMIFADEINVPVAIDECVELAKAYGTDESSRFVNGLLGNIADDLEAGSDPVARALEELAAQRAARAEELGEDEGAYADAEYDDDFGDAYDEGDEYAESARYGYDNDEDGYEAYTPASFFDDEPEEFVAEAEGNEDEAAVADEADAEPVADAEPEPAAGEDGDI